MKDVSNDQRLLAAENIAAAVRLLGIEDEVLNALGVERDNRLDEQLGEFTRLSERVKNLADRLSRVTIEAPELDTDEVATDVAQSVDLEYEVRLALGNHELDTGDLEDAQSEVEGLADEARDLAGDLQSLVNDGEVVPAHLR
jgi:hypothetical protein